MKLRNYIKQHFFEAAITETVIQGSQETAIFPFNVFPDYLCAPLRTTSRDHQILTARTRGSNKPIGDQHCAASPVIKRRRNATIHI